MRHSKSDIVFAEVLTLLKLSIVRVKTFFTMPGTSSFQSWLCRLNTVGLIASLLR